MIDFGRIPDRRQLGRQETVRSQAADGGKQTFR